MSSLYLSIDIASIAIPFLASFHPRLKFYKKWKYLFPAMAITTTMFIVWDIIFTYQGVWGFNDKYLIGYNLLHLPIEEWLFFLCIPYACIFSHYAIIELAPKFSLPKKWTSFITVILLLFFLTISLVNYNKLYTQVNYYFAFLILLFSYRYRYYILSKYYITFLFMLIPFFLVNGVLTGSFIDEQIVWYNNQEYLGIRLFTIPFEDITYAFTMILSTLFFMNLFMPLDERVVENKKGI